MPPSTGKQCEVEILGEVPRTISGKKGKKGVDIEVGIDAIVKQEVTCCSRGCLQRWAADLGSHCRMVLETQRYAVAAMSEVIRQEFFVRKISDLLIPKTAKSARKKGDNKTGKSVSDPRSFSSFPPPPPP